MKQQQRGGAEKLWKFIRQTWLIYVLAIVCGTLTVVGLAVFKTPEYSSSVQISVAQRYTISDPYTATKSATAVRDTLASVVHTSLFLSQVQESGLVNLDYLATLSEEDRRTAWTKMVEINSAGNAPLMTIIGYDANPGQAEAIANAVSQTLIIHGADYHSSPDTITLKIVDSPLTSQYPTRPNLLTNGAAATMLGAIIGAIIVFLRSNAPFPFAKRATKPTAPNQPTDDVVDVTAEPVHRQAAETLPPPQYNVLDMQNFHHNLPKKEDLPQHSPGWKE